ncbi:protein O-mannosyl-transferase TMTC3 [Trichonephila clavipes]|nr:protein O-mannosyl-transferase TMTC3 [Trichonephila clavipes]
MGGLCASTNLTCNSPFSGTGIRIRYSTTQAKHFQPQMGHGSLVVKEQSHKSYRPVCVFTYRLNYLLHGLQPFGYHLANVVLHALVCMLYKKTCSLFVSEGTAFLAALLFAIHPLHTEAVTGVVGRAEILSSFFYLLTFLSYTSATSKRSTTGE